ncbi:FCD domain-containing protein [Acetobacter okinawensis]|uniref:FCD domain-containing protein n=2 Tax=Acetobacteraceae TaxID=433 RepID=UPI0006881233|nr:FCD domain-containing protein [Acetobacter okinawensis]
MHKKEAKRVYNVGGLVLSVIKIERPQRVALADYVEKNIRREILEGRLHPGDRLVTRELAELLGTSVTPVREALLRLVAIGVLEASPAQSFTVPLLESRQYLELAEIRRAIEPLATVHAMKNLTKRDIAELDGILQDFRQAKRKGDVSAALSFNHAFRFRLYTAADKPVLLEIIEQLWLKIGPMFNYLFPQSDVEAEMPHNYDLLLSAIKSGDEDAVCALIKKSIDRGTEIILHNLQTYLKR